MGGRVVVIGGGFGGAYCVQALERLRRQAPDDTVLVDRHNYFVFYPLLVEAGTAFLDRQRSNRHFYLVSEVTGSTPPRHDKAWIACTVLAAMVLAAALDLVPMVAAALVAAGAVICLRCISSTEARRSIEWESLLLIAASFGLARAMEKTGLAELVAHSTIGAAGGRLPRLPMNGRFEKLNTPPSAAASR